MDHDEVKRTVDALLGALDDFQIPEHARLNMARHIVDSMRHATGLDKAALLCTEILKRME